jgi:hypothetical protein
MQSTAGPGRCQEGTVRVFHSHSLLTALWCIPMTWLTPDSKETDVDVQARP